MRTFCISAVSIFLICASYSQATEPNLDDLEAQAKLTRPEDFSDIKDEKSAVLSVKRLFEYLNEKNPEELKAKAEAIVDAALARPSTAEYIWGFLTGRTHIYERSVVLQLWALQQMIRQLDEKGRL